MIYKAFMQQTLANCNRDSNFKKDYKLKFQFQNFKKAASKESNTVCACVLLKVVDQNSYLLPRFCFTVASFAQ